MAKNITAAPPAAPPPASFESAMDELDSLVARMENGQLPLEESITAYQRGTELLKYCEKVLADAQQRIQVLDGSDADSKLKDFQIE
jgi:exodeoxyribonuclease VII small subunit